MERVYFSATDTSVIVYCCFEYKPQAVDPRTPECSYVPSGGPAGSHWTLGHVPDMSRSGSG